MTRLLSTAFRSLKPHHHVRSSPNPCSVPKPSKASPSSLLQPSQSPSASSSSNRSKSKHSWSVYLILSTSTPIKTYVGVTTDLSRRLRQHNGELKGGAKASRVGRPWVCACIIQGFMDRSQACEFESKWKNFSRKLPRKKNIDGTEKQLGNGSLQLLQHRQAALNRVKSSIICSHLEIDWQMNPW